MRHFTDSVVLTALICLSPFTLTASNPGTTANTISDEAAEALRLPRDFERNDGQAGATVRYLSRGPDYQLLLGDRDAVLAVDGATVRLRFLDTAGPARVEGVGALPARSHYLIGGPGREPVTDVPHFERVRYARLYPGIDVVFYGAPASGGSRLVPVAQGYSLHGGDRLEFDFVVDPNADPSQIALEFSGMERLTLDDSGNLILETGVGTLRQHRPAAYQIIDGTRQMVHCHYRIGEEGRVTLDMGEYRRDLPLVIDPVVDFATYIGGGADDFVTDIAVDDLGFVYLTGYTRSSNFPIANSFQPTIAGYSDAFVIKLNRTGNALVYATYFGGENSDYARALALDSDGHVYIAGDSLSAYLPTTVSAYKHTCCGVFAAELTWSGNGLYYATYVGSGTATGIAVNSAGEAHIAGWTANQFPVTPGSYQTASGGGSDAFVAKLNAGGTALKFSTFLGGSGTDRAQDVSLDPLGNVYVGGFTESSDFPVTPGAPQVFIGGLRDGFLTKLTPNGDRLEYSTYAGGSGNDYIWSVAVGPAGTGYGAGVTESVNFPTTPGAFRQYMIGGSPWGFALQVNGGGTGFAYSTLLGEGVENGSLGIVVDPFGYAWIAGATHSQTFPVTANALQRTNAGARDAFLAELAPSGSQMVFSTLFGGILEDYALGLALDTAGGVFLAGHTRSPNLPTTTTAYQPTYRGGIDAFVLKTRNAAGTCSYQLGPATTSVLGTVAAGGFGVSAPSGCVWSAVSTDSWITLTGSTAGISNGVVDFQVAANPTAEPRTGYLIAANQFHTVMQAGGTVSSPSVGVAPGLYDPASGSWFLRYEQSGGAAEITFQYGPGGAGFVPLVGDWDGNGSFTPGLYDPASGTWFLKNSHGDGAADTVFQFGPGGSGFLPLVGDWDGDGRSTIGLYHTSSGTWFLRNDSSGGVADITFQFGPGGSSFLPLVGDWDGDGRSTIGLYHTSSGTWFLRNDSSGGVADITFQFGPGGSSFLPLVGDWDGDGRFTPGLYVRTAATWFLRNTSSGGAADVTFQFGPSGSDFFPLSGVW